MTLSSERLTLDGQLISGTIFFCGYAERLNYREPSLRQSDGDDKATATISFAILADSHCVLIRQMLICCL
jgi:hypothetical protein